MLCETKNGKTVLTFEDTDCEPLVGNYTLWDMIILESMTAQDPYFFLDQELTRDEYGSRYCCN